MILLFMFTFLFVTVNAQQRELEDMSFFEKFVIEKTRLSDIDQSRMEWTEMEDETILSLGFRFGQYTPTESDSLSLGFNPETIYLLFFEKNGEQILGSIRMYHSFNLNITKDYNADKRNKSSMLTHTYNIINSLADEMKKGQQITRNINITTPLGREDDSFIRYNLWQTDTYQAVTEAMYSDWPLVRKYKDMQWSWQEGGELLTSVSLNAMSITLKKIIEKEKDLKPVGDFKILEKDDLSEYIDEDAINKLDKILADAANNVMEEAPLKIELWNDPSYLPEGLKHATKEEIEEYRWIPLSIGGDDMTGIRPEQQFYLNFDLKEYDHHNRYRMEMRGDTWMSSRAFSFVVQPSSRLDIKVNGQEVSIVDDSGVYDVLDIFENYLDMSRDLYTLAFDSEGNLVFLNSENEMHRAIFKRGERKNDAMPMPSPNY